MTADALTERLLGEITRIPVVDSHTHIEPSRPAATGLEDVLGYHYFTELAHSCGMSKEPLSEGIDPRERCRAILRHVERFDNTVQYNWLTEIAISHFGLDALRLSANDADRLFDACRAATARPDWEQTLWERTRLERVFLTNLFDDPLTGFDSSRYVPCLRTDDLVFHLHRPDVRGRLEAATGVPVRDWASLRSAVGATFQRFQRSGARACAISLPPDFVPSAGTGRLPDGDGAVVGALTETLRNGPVTPAEVSIKTFWLLTEACREFRMPFDLMIGVNRGVYQDGVFQGQDLFDHRTSLIGYADVFNAFPQVDFCVSVLSSGLNQELVSYAWIFPNVYAHGHWWYSNVPAYIENDLRARLTAVPKWKLLGYYSDAYKLEFVLPKFNMYRRSLARVLADDFVRPGRLTESGAVDLAHTLLRANVERVFRLVPAAAA
jgi:glucuronate isomerase